MIYIFIYSYSLIFSLNNGENSENNKPDNTDKYFVFFTDQSLEFILTTTNPNSWWQKQNLWQFLAPSLCARSTEILAAKAQSFRSKSWHVFLALLRIKLIITLHHTVQLSDSGRHVRRSTVVVGMLFEVSNDVNHGLIKEHSLLSKLLGTACTTPDVGTKKKEQLNRICYWRWIRPGRSGAELVKAGGISHKSIEMLGTLFRWLFYNCVLLCVVLSHVPCKAL